MADQKDKLEEKKLSECTDEELMEKAKKLKSDSILSAFAIGFMVGIIVFSVVVNSIGLVTLIPLFFIYKALKGDKKNKELREVLKERNLK